MEWSLAHVWLALALLLCLAELVTAGVFLFLALGIAAGLTALAAFLGFSVEWQLVTMGVSSGLLVPIAVWWIRPYFTPKQVDYGTTGTGVEQGQQYRIERRGFDDATVIRMNGDLYRIRVAETGETVLPSGTPVVFDRFDGTTAIVHHLQSTGHGPSMQ